METASTDFDAAATLRFARLGTDPDVTSCYVLDPAAEVLWRSIDDARQEVDALRDALAAGWDVGPELAHQEAYLAGLEAAI